MSRISFGVRGAQAPALIHAVVATAWYGTQTYLPTYLAALTVVVLLLRLARSLRPWAEDSVLGLSTLGRARFLGLWAVQLVILSVGVEVVRRFQDWAGRLVWLVVLALAVWMLVGDRLAGARASGLVTGFGAGRTGLGARGFGVHGPLLVYIFMYT